MSEDGVQIVEEKKKRGRQSTKSVEPVKVRFSLLVLRKIVGL